MVTDSMTAATASQDSMSFIESFVDAIWNDRAYDGLDEFVTDDVVQHGPISGMTTTGRDKIIANIRQYHEAFSDMEVSVVLSIADEDGEYVCSHLEYTGTHDGELMGIAPTERTVQTTANAIYRIEDGRVAEIWVIADLYGLFNQLGAQPMTGPLAD